MQIFTWNLIQIFIIYFLCTVLSQPDQNQQPNEIENIVTNIGKLQNDYSTLESRIQGLSSTCEAITANSQNQNQEQINEVKNQINEVKTRVNQLSDQFKNIESKLTKLENEQKLLNQNEKKNKELLKLIEKNITDIYDKTNWNSSFLLNSAYNTTQELAYKALYIASDLKTQIVNMNQTIVNAYLETAKTKTYDAWEFCKKHGGVYGNETINTLSRIPWSKVADKVMWNNLYENFQFFADEWLKWINDFVFPVIKSEIFRFNRFVIASIENTRNNIHQHDLYKESKRLSKPYLESIGVTEFETIILDTAILFISIILLWILFQILLKFCDCLCPRVNRSIKIDDVKTENKHENETNKKNKKTKNNKK